MSTIPQFDPPVATEITTIEDAVHHNARLPIHNLPTDIFTQCLPLFIINSYPYYVPCPKEWASVCKFWRDVIFSTPYLWSIVSSQMSPVDVHLALKRSRTTPLDVYITDNSYDDALRSYITHVGVQSSRWRSFSILYPHMWIALPQEACILPGIPDPGSSQHRDQMEHPNDDRTQQWAAITVGVARTRRLPMGLSPTLQSHLPISQTSKQLRTYVHPTDPHDREFSIVGVLGAGRRKTRQRQRAAVQLVAAARDTSSSLALPFLTLQRNGHSPLGAYPRPALQVHLLGDALSPHDMGSRCP